MLADFATFMKLLITSLMLLALASSSMGRAVKVWSYQELFDQADLVIIGRPISTKDIKEKEKRPAAPTVGVEAVAIEFEIQGAMKGDKVTKL